MKKWLAVSAGILVLLCVAVVAIFRAFLPSPIPEPKLIADAPLAIHVNEVDLTTTGMILISIDNLTREDLKIDVGALGESLNDDLRFFDPTGNELGWSDSRGRRGPAFSADNYWQWNGQWSERDHFTIEAGRSENFTLVVNDTFALRALEWAARLRAEPERLVYVIDGEIMLIEGGSRRATPVTARGEARYKPRP